MFGRNMNLNQVLLKSAKLQHFSLAVFARFIGSQMSIMTKTTV